MQCLLASRYAAMVGDEQSGGRLVVTALDPWFHNNLVCPADLSPLHWDGQQLTGACGHSYAVVDGIPVLLQGDVDQTHRAAKLSLQQVTDLSQEEAPPETHRSQPEPGGAVSGVHPFVKRLLAATNGIMYLDVTPTEYPIPDIRLPRAQGEQWMLDIGCNWGRWCVAGSRKGYRVVGIDPSLEAVKVARQVARQLGENPLFVAADGRYLPFKDNTFDVVFSFSVLQHFSKENVRKALRSVRRVLKRDGVSLVQMLNRIGLRSLYNQARLSFHEPDQFAVRYWSTKELHDTFASAIGPSRLSVDAFFSANAQTSDLDLLPKRFQLVVRTSERLRSLTNRIPAFKYVADSIYITSSDNPARLREVDAVVTKV